MRTNESQANAILAHLQDGNGITPMDDLDLCGCFRLSARIADLKKRGYDIVTEKIKAMADEYAAEYVPMYQKVAGIAFVDGMKKAMEIIKNIIEL